MAGDLYSVDGLPSMPHMKDLLERQQQAQAVHDPARPKAEAPTPLSQAAFATMSTPLLGDVLGLAADVEMYATEPESHNAMNYVLTAMGVLPFVPSAASQVKRGITAYHGSPHDFDKFSSANIGTGEGAQAYGHGLYFGGREGTAKSYADALTPDEVHFSVDGKPIPDDEAYEFMAVWQTAADDAISGEDTIGKWIKYSEEELSNPRKDFIGSRKDAREQLDLLKRLHGKKVEMHQEQGHMYRVNLDVSEDELLDWDLPLSEQPKIVEKLKQSRSPKVRGVVETLGDLNEPLKSYDMDLGPKAGDSIVRRLALEMEGRGSGGVKSSEALRKAGIKGIKYKDQLSRGTDGGTSNYVIFDDRLITIAKKYGIAIPVAAAMIGSEGYEEI